MPLAFVLTGCLTTPASSSGGIGGITVQNTNPSAIIGAAQTVFAQSGYTVSSVNYPDSISFGKPASKLGELKYEEFLRGITSPFLKL